MFVFVYTQSVMVGKEKKAGWQPHTRPGGTRFSTVRSFMPLPGRAGRGSLCGVGGEVCLQAQRVHLGVLGGPTR